MFLCTNSLEVKCAQHFTMVTTKVNFVNFALFQPKISILPSKSSVKIHDICCTFDEGKSILANLRCLILDIS